MSKARKKSKVRPKDRLLSLSRLNSLQSLTDENIVIKGKEISVENMGEKMSEVITEFAKPLTDTCNSLEDVKNFISLSIMVWNICILPLEEQGKLLKDLLLLLSKNFYGAEEECSDIISLLVSRKNKLFPNNKRFIKDYVINITKNNTIDFRVESTPDEIIMNKVSEKLGL